VNDLKRKINIAKDLIARYRPANDVLWADSLLRLDETSFSMKRSWEPFKKFSYTPSRRHIRLSRNFMEWNDYDRSSLLLHESMHLRQFDLQAKPKWLNMAFSYSQRNGRYRKELGALRENVRWWMQVGNIGVYYLEGVLTPRLNAETWIHRVAEFFGPNYKMGRKFSRKAMRETLRQYVIDAYNEGYGKQ